MEPNVVAKEKRQTEYFVKNERTNVVTIVCHDEVRIQPFDTVRVTKAVVESRHALELQAAGVVTLITK